MDQRIKNIKISLNEILETFEFPEFIHEVNSLFIGFGCETEEEEKIQFALLDDFERKFKIAEEREKLLFSEKTLEKQLFSKLPFDIFYFTSKEGKSIFKKYYYKAAKGNLDEKTADEAFAFYYLTEDELEFEGKLFLLWNILMAEKLPEFVLVKWEAFIEI